MSARAYYNEIDPFAAAWLRELINAGHIAPGDVDERSIEVVAADDLRGYTQCHFFAGIGVWSAALRGAGWPDHQRVWSGSCPCQPFSSAGAQAGFSDERHLWPEFARLIRECRPPVVFGEQVASPLGRAWLDAVHADLEDMDYACGAFDLCAAGIGAPHIRQRLYWVVNDERARLEGHAWHGDNRDEPGWLGTDAIGSVASTSAVGGMGITDMRRCEVPNVSVRPARQVAPAAVQRGIGGWSEGAGDSASITGATHGVWGAADWLFCTDGKWRPVEPESFPLAHGAPARVGRLRGYGNAIVRPLAQAFIEAYLDVSAGA